MVRTLPLIVAATLCAAAAAAEEPCAMTYPTFEATVPHIDLDACPPAVADDDAFCRAVTGQDVLHVFAFSFEGEQCLVAMETVETGGFSVTFD